jgi:cobalt/nickel-transporting P-type ATPase D
MEKTSKNNVLKVGSKNLNSENWRVYHPSGRHMFTCGEKKADWYLKRNLAISIGIKKIQFTFDPKGDGFEDNEVFGRSMRITRCVVTGSINNLQRHHIVPYCYRTYFPNQFKSKNHHDVVLINDIIHSNYEQHANSYKDEIARIYDVKTIEELNTEYTLKLREIGKERGMVLNTFHSLFKSYGKVDNKVIVEKLHFISEKTNIDYQIISNCSYLQLYKIYLFLKEENEKEVNGFKEENRIFYDHGYRVVQKLSTEEMIMDFVKLWRVHFIETMQPKYMPKGWSINFRIKTKNI